MELACVHPPRDRQGDGDGAVGVWQKAIRICDDPLACGIAPSRGIDGRNRYVDAVRIAAGLASESAEVKAIATARIENDVAR